MAVSRRDTTTKKGGRVSDVLDGRRALVTGGSRGIGWAVVERLARDGATITFGYHSDHRAAEEVAAGVAATGGRATAVQADLAEPGAAPRLWDAVEAFAGSVDILVNNAAIGIVGTLAELSDEDYERVMQVNVRAVFDAMREAARRMPDGGNIVNVSTVDTVLPRPGISLYAASKSAVEQLTVIAAHELGGRGITVNTVSPGATETDMLSDHNRLEGMEMMRVMSPLGRLGQPDDVADVIGFLVAPDGRWMTAQNLRAGGGIR
jgi:3-oxoacyl-[acyl-carrier protein] reductase